MSLMPPVIAIDFEASCLPRHGRSFPIEVGISGESLSRSWLIRPHVDWAGWDWTREAEQLHGISRERIAREGQEAAQVLAELVALTAGARIVADSLIDQYWLDTLAQAAGMASPFRIDHVSMVMDERGAAQGLVVDAVAAADRTVTHRHRAGADAQWLFAFLSYLSDATRPALFSVETLEKSLPYDSAQIWVSSLC